MNKIIKKLKGFTLAELLISLGIISIIAVVTTPMLIYKIDNAKVGPSLQKAKTIFEKGVAQMLLTRDVSSLTDLDLTEKGSNGMESVVRDLQGYIKASYKDYDSESYAIRSRTSDTSPLTLQHRGDASNHARRYFCLDTEDGMTYLIARYSNIPIEPKKELYRNIPNNQLIGEVYVDIDGSNGPNTESKDVFMFLLYNDGILRPYGARGALRSENPDFHLWSAQEDSTQISCGNAKWSTQFPRTCTGSIFENNLRVIYKR